MNSETNQVVEEEVVEQENGFWKFFIDFAVVAAAAGLYFKTAEVMTALSPNAILGQTGLAILYGYGVAALIEGVTLALHFLKGFSGNDRAEYYKWFLFGVSTLCQFLDQTLVKNALNGTQATPVQAFFNWAALGILPAVFFGLLWVKGGTRKSVRKVRKQWGGLVPSFQRFLYGDQNSKFVQTRVLNTDVSGLRENETSEQIKPSNNNHEKRSEEPNFQ